MVLIVSTQIEDLILPFQIANGAARGRLVRLGPSLDTILGAHDYPPEVAALLAEALAVATALASGLKFDGIFTLQAKGDGPVSMLVADLTSDGALRGYARYDDAALKAAAGKALEPVPRLLGSGYLAFTVDQGPDTDRYQGIVELVGATLAECIHEYFTQSEQLPTAIKVATSRDEAGHWRAAALMLQRMPGGTDLPADEAEEDWRRGVIMMASAKDAEILGPDLAPDKVVYRLFHAEGLSLFDLRGLEARCRCSREKVTNTLASFPRAEVEDLQDEAGEVVVSCEFCRTAYVFNPADIQALYGSQA